MARLVNGWRRGAWMPLVLVVLAPGCVTPDVPLFRGSAPDEERPCRILSYWDRNVRIVLDTKSQSLRPREMPMLAGRVYFFGAEAKDTLTPRGLLIVDFYDLNVPADVEPPLLSRTMYDPNSLQKMRSRNLLGMGYTVLADWPNYDPKYTRVKVQVTFIPEKGGEPVFAEPAIVSLQGATVERYSRVDLPGLRTAPVPPGTSTPAPLGPTPPR